MKNRYHTVRITAIERETENVNNYIFDKKITAKPGQYLMIWLPGKDEKPFSIGNAQPLMLSVAKIGPATEEIHKLKVGDVVTYRGPYGKSFTAKGNKMLFVGGGYGVVPLYFLALTVPKRKRKNITVIIGARTKAQLPFMKKFKELGCRVISSTNDGSHGFPVFTTEMTQVILRSGKIDSVYTCGPTAMMRIIAKICQKKNVYCQVSLETYFKCGGMGLCGECSAHGKLVCTDGPVFNGNIFLK